MKLLLTSAGLKTFEIAQKLVLLLGKNPINCRALIVSNDTLPEHIPFIDDVKKELADVNIHKTTVFDLSKDDERLLSKDIDLIYVCGGNTFHILEKMRRKSVDFFIKNNVLKGVVYVGVSAGSIIAGPDIRVAGFGSEGDLNDIQLQDLSGLHLTEVIIFPHVRPELVMEVDEFRKQTTHPVYALSDIQAISISNDVVEMIG